MIEGATTWRFPRTFWIANSVELCERAAYYGTFIALFVYLTRVVGLIDETAGIVCALFGALIYLFPFFTGAAADRMGFRRALMLAFALLAVGYGMLGVFDTLAPVSLGLFLIVLGGSFVKPIISGTVSKSSSETNRARAFSIFYMVVNIGSFTGKTVVKQIRTDLGVENVPYFSAAAALLALIVVIAFYWPKDTGEQRPSSIIETVDGMFAAMSNLRFLALILITAGFWAIQGQLYASMPAYVLRMVGEHAAPEWYANINPLVVVIFVVFITQLVRKWRPEISIAVALAMIPCSSLAMALSHLFDGDVAILGMMVHPITLMMVIGIGIQGLSECFLSPKYLEYASRQSPPGQEGTYLGYAHMNTFFAWLFGFVLGGFLLAAYCPDPLKMSFLRRLHWAQALESGGPMPVAWEHAHYLWYAFVGVGVISFLALLVYIVVTRRIDARRPVSPAPDPGT